MALPRGHLLRLTKGDYGIPLSVHLMSCCDTCNDDLSPTDEIHLIIERGGKTLIKKKTTWAAVKADDGYFTNVITADEAKLLDCGLYTWRIRVLRKGEIRRTLLTDTLEVVL